MKRGISCSSLLRLRLATVNTPRNDMEVCLAMTEEGAPHSGKRKMSLRLLVVIASLSHLSLRAKGVAILVPSETRNFMLQFASATPRNR